MSTSNDSSSQGTSTRPYLIRALHEWCTDNGFTPYLAVYVDRSVQVPQEYVKNNEIVLNVSYEATSQLQMGNDFIEFKARFGGSARELIVPVDHVIAIYARENGQGMAFPVPTPMSDDEENAVEEAHAGERGSLADISSDKDKIGGLHLATSAAPDEGSGEEPTDPTPTPGGNGARPALRRVK